MSTSQAAQFAPVAVETVPASGWREACGQATAAGDGFAALYATAPHGLGPTVRAVFRRPPGWQVIACADDAVPTIVDLVPAAAWDEREAHDLYGVRFVGHEPLRPLVTHVEDVRSWTTPVVGHDPFAVAVGPVHAGVIESGHFRFHVVGERILLVDLRLFYKHRGLERAAEGASLGDGIAFVQRACGACAVANTVAYAHACEEALGAWPDASLRRARGFLLELERLYNHLNDLAAVCAGVGFAPGNMAFASLKERAQRLNHAVAGHRFLFGAIAVCASDVRVDGVLLDHTRKELESLRSDTARLWREVLFNAPVQDRFAGVGVLTQAVALRLGAVGPAARAAGVPADERALSPRLDYDRFESVVAPGGTGDVSARVEQRALELDATFTLLARLLEHPIEPGRAVSGGPGQALAVGAVESPRGRTACVLEREGDTVTRMHLRTASFANWPALARSTPGNILPDFPLINKSFELCYACCDR